ncbi:Putative 2EXR domain-containing protein [Colletotrichum destructivum]|uniref:2EXR domain-containing protein n=1 Tax=Colletotrichum destructivum TaxID=34406 RepID=A0AAX4IWF8_9PEZI|nr:Putative 2EXR domain-containing protein [Colletotrichum destructivum]
MTTRTFHGFPLLPGEIRNQIWDLAVPPAHFRGVHYFSVLAPDLQEASEAFASQLIYGDAYQLISATWLPDDSISTLGRAPGNPSTYAIDWGLWTACKESRSFMCHRYGIVKWSDFLHKQQQQQEKRDQQQKEFRRQKPDSEEVPATFVLKNDDSFHSLALFPRHDLIALQLNGNYRLFMITLPRLGFRSRTVDRTDIYHVAIEFDPSWDVNELEQYQREVEGDIEREENRLDPKLYDTYDHLVDIRRSGMLMGATLWFIDGRLSRKAAVVDEGCTDMGPRPSAQFVFEGQDNRYFGMPYYSIMDLYEYDEEVKGENNAVYFLSTLEEIAVKQEAVDMRLDVEEDAHELWMYLGRSVGLLAREPF